MLSLAAQRALLPAELYLPLSLAAQRALLPAELYLPLSHAARGAASAALPLHRSSLRVGERGGALIGRWGDWGRFVARNYGISAPERL